MGHKQRSRGRIGGAAGLALAWLACASCGHLAPRRGTWSFTVEAIGLTATSIADDGPAQEGRRDGVLLYTGPSDEGTIVFALECDTSAWSMLARRPGTRPLTGADIGWRILDGQGAPWTGGRFSAVEGDFRGGKVGLTWELGNDDGIVQDVGFLAYAKRPQDAGGPSGGGRRLVYCTIVKPDLVMHRPGVQDPEEPAIIGWDDTNGNGRRDPGEPELENEPGLFVGVADADVPVGPEDDALPADPAWRATALKSMSRHDVVLPGGHVLPGNGLLTVTVGNPALVRFFRPDTGKLVLGGKAGSTWTGLVSELPGVVLRNGSRETGVTFYVLYVDCGGDASTTVSFTPPSEPAP